MNRLLIALQFLTILPIRTKALFREEDFKSVFAFFPAAGVFIGLIPAVLVLFLGSLPHLALVALVLAVYTVTTGALHIDGLADTCDGLFSGKPKEKILEIMRDSRIGTYGAVAVCLLLLLKFAFLSSLSGDVLWKMLILTPMFARWVQSVACAGSKYAREDGKAALFFKVASVKDVITGGIFSLAMFYVFFGVKGLVLACAAGLPAAIFIRFADQKIGGMTGDTVGAASEITELSVLFLCLVILS
ncbi:MAG: adenosylcobinamide-GDP ribazoletransferase [Candidatus Omnitrophica bacterium]|nr:adenosylcobinamide-GDP ribazoletransferase [Candidatus Omnitrophota bacterium]